VVVGNLLNKKTDLKQTNIFLI